MSAALLLAGPDGGEVRYLRAIRVAHEPPVLELERIKVNRAPVNEDHNSELALSARHAGTVALHLLYRELNRNDPVTRMWFDIEPPSTAVTGRSAELFFGLATYLHLGRSDLPAGILNASFMATGTLDRDGNVGSVEHVSVKVRAALTAYPAAGTRLFYPRADEGQIDDTLRLQCRDQSLLLCPVDRIDEALAALGVPIIGSWPSSVSPFRSLQAFETSFSRVFFGRQREVAALVTLLDARAVAGKPGALIIGASGAGKSSFCLAGLIPALTKARPGLDYAVWRPRDSVSGLDDDPADERHIVESIVAQWQVRDANQPGLTITGATIGIERLDHLSQCVASEDSDSRIFVVDQFEELFTLDFTPEARIAFARFLQSLQAKGVWVIGTLRSEFYSQYLELADADGAPVLTPMFEGDGQYNLPRMSREALAQVIVRPAELAGLRFEQRSDEVTLAQALLADAMATDDALPLLGFALQTLYDEAERPAIGDDRAAVAPRTLSFAAYNRLGGLSGAIGVVAARAFGALDAAAQAELPALLSALAVPSSDGNRETARPALLAQWPVGSPGRRLIDALTDIRVLVSEQGFGTDAPAQVRVAHEALFSHWEFAAQLLSASRQSRLLIEDFRRRARQWEGEGRPRDALLSSKRDIENARAVQEFVPASDEYRAVAAFINQSIVRVRRQKQILYTSVAGVALALVSVTAWALNERAESVANERQALSALSDVQEFTARTDAALSAALKDELERGTNESPGKGAAGIILDANTGAVLAIVSLSTPDPDSPDQASTSIPPNRAIEQVYEFGSAFKPIAAAAIINADRGIDLNHEYPTSPLSFNGFQIRDPFVREPKLTLGNSILSSSNVVIIRAADQLGIENMQHTLQSLNLDRAIFLDNIKTARPIWTRGSRASNLTMAMGHGIAITPLHLASAYAAVVNGGIWHSPTLATAENSTATQGQRVFSPATSQEMRQILRRSVTDGTGSRADVPGLSVGGRTGMAAQVGPNGYLANKVTATFVGAFPMENPKYVVLVMFDGLPALQENSGQPGSFVAATTAGRVVRRIAPLLGFPVGAKVSKFSKPLYK